MSGAVGPSCICSAVYPGKNLIIMYFIRNVLLVCVQISPRATWAVQAGPQRSRRDSCKSSFSVPVRPFPHEVTDPLTQCFLCATGSWALHPAQPPQAFCSGPHDSSKKSKSDKMKSLQPKRTWLCPCRPANIKWPLLFYCCLLTECRDSVWW